MISILYYFDFVGASFIIMKQIGIYKITSPNKKIYIGQSWDIERRWKKYRILNCKSQLKLYASFLKYGVDKHKFEILQLCDKEQLNELEKYYVDLFQTFNSKYGLNLQDGGGASALISDETRKKMSLVHTGKKLSEETKRKLSEAGKKRKDSPETKLKKSISRIGIIFSEETKLKMSISKKGILMSDETKKKLSDINMGKYVSDETKDKIRKARLNYWSMKKNNQ